MIISLKMKIVITVVVTAIFAAIKVVLVPGSQLAANSAIVGQLDQTDSSSFLNSMIGNGSNATSIILGIIFLLAVVFIWTRKSSD